MAPGVIVVIGRNEGERLRVSLASALRGGVPVIYVDSGSTDGSPELAQSMGCAVVALDPSRPFSAARGRNEGFEAAVRLDPPPEWIQFVDGDCELAPGWLEYGSSELGRNAGVAIVSGRLKEHRPESSIYNRLCQMEWEGFPGRNAECGGNMMVRAPAFRQVSGFNPEIAAGEELDYCYRIKRAGWKILNLDHDMATHDAAMTTFGQWWKRTLRGGHAYALAAYVHRGGGDRYAWRPNLSNFAWGLVLPVIAIGLIWPTSGWSLLLFAAYPLLVVRVALGRRRKGNRWRDAWLYALFTVIGKFPQVWGQFRFLRSRKPDSGGPVHGKSESLEKADKVGGTAEPGPKS